VGLVSCDTDENFQESDSFRDASISLVNGTLPDFNAKGEHDMQAMDGR